MSQFPPSQSSAAGGGDEGNTERSATTLSCDKVCEGWVGITVVPVIVGCEGMARTSWVK